jgi:hypothetical protein
MIPAICCYHTMLGEKVAKVVILSVQLLLAFSRDDAKLKML